MFRNRLFNILIVVALVMVTVFTIQQALETTRVVAAAGGPATSLCRIPAVDLTTISTMYVEELGITVIRSDNGPTGVDGGLIHLLSDRQACSQ